MHKYIPPRSNYRTGDIVARDGRETHMGRSPVRTTALHYTLTHMQYRKRYIRCHPWSSLFVLDNSFVLHLLTIVLVMKEGALLPPHYVAIDPQTRRQSESSTPRKTPAIDYNGSTRTFLSREYDTKKTNGRRYLFME